MAEIKLSDLPWGALNWIQDQAGALSGDRRRTSPTTAIRLAIESLYSKDTGVTGTTGVIVGFQEVSYASYQDKTSLLEQYVYRKNDVNSVQSSNRVVYKVYIGEKECRPIPTLGRNDPVLFTYPDIPSVIPGETLEIGTIVAIEYDDPENLFNPRIVRKIGGPIQLESTTPASLREMHREGKPAPLGTPGKKGGSAGIPTPESPAGLQYKEFRNGTPEWTAIQIHYTVTFNTQDAIDVLAKRGLSYNYIIDKDGTVTTTVDPAKAVAIHAKGGWSARSIGISFVNLGYDSQYAGGGWGGRMSPPLEEWEQFPPHADRWEPYTPAAIQAGKTLVRQLVAQFPDIKTIFGHEETSDDKLDPGPAFDKYWPEYEALVPSGRGSIARSTKKRGSSSNA